jgi:hypothetical protein
MTIECVNEILMLRMNWSGTSHAAKWLPRCDVLLDGLILNCHQIVVCQVFQATALNQPLDDEAGTSFFNKTRVESRSFSR